MTGVAAPDDDAPGEKTAGGGTAVSGSDWRAGRTVIDEET
jgi:hypothetical protein